MNNGKLKGTIRPQGVLKGRISRVIETVDPVIQPLEVTENGEYTAPENVHGFSPIKVDVPLRYEEGYEDGYQASQDSIKLQEKTITENGEYETDEGFTGMSKVTVAVPIKEEQTKALDVSENGSYNIFPDEGKVLSAASVNVNIPPKEEQEKTVDITANGTVEVVPDEGKTLSKVTANVAVNPTDVGKPYIDTSKMTDFERLGANNRLNDCLNCLDTSNGEIFTYMFVQSKNLLTIPLIDTSKGTDFSYMFSNCSALSEVPPLDVSNGGDFSSMFTSCSSLVYVPRFDTKKASKLQFMFSGCSSLKTIEIDASNSNANNGIFSNCKLLESVSIVAPKNYNLSTNTFQNCTALKNITIGEGWAVSIYLHYSNNLTVESLHGMIENLADLTGKTAKVFQVGTTNLAKIDEAHMTMLNNKNWNYQ